MHCSLDLVKWWHVFETTELSMPTFSLMPLEDRTATLAVCK